MVPESAREYFLSANLDVFPLSSLLIAPFKLLRVSISILLS